MNDSVRFAIDQPGRDKRLRCGTINYFEGWVINSNEIDPVVRVNFTINGLTVGTLPIDYDRPDLLPIFGKTMLGFSGFINISEEYYQQALRVEALAQSGERFFLNNFELNEIVTAEEKEFKEKNNLPDDVLMRLVVSNIDPALFLRHGKEGVELIEDILKKNRIDIHDFKNVLDFGVGCGRILRWWREYSSDISFWGTDINEDLIAWCRENIPYGQFSVNSLHPPTAYRPDMFDLLYAYSIFTHLSLPTQAEWLREFSRILVPGGYAVISVHGDHDAVSLSDEQQARYRRDGFLMQSANLEGKNTCAVFQNRAISERLFSECFTIVDHLPAARPSTSRQDVYMLKKR
jgi:SAM-dependent methyltransferase